MIAAMEDVRKSAEYADKSVLAACHTFRGDPYRPDVRLDYAMGVSTYPYVNFDFQTGGLGTLRRYLLHDWRCGRCLEILETSLG